jgi:uncharacterized protein YndB with AHSA1/START domain
MEGAIKPETILEKTGRPWPEWLALLDAWGAAEQDHASIARHLGSLPGVSAWWAQTLTVRYEQERGMRAVGEKPDGFEVSVSRTIQATPEAAYAAITQPEHWAGWFTTEAEADLQVGGRYRTADGDAGAFLTLDPPRRMRMSWEHAEHAPGTLVEFDITPKGEDRVTVRVTHRRLADAAARDDMRGGWRGAMDSLRSYLETGRGIAG